MYKAAKAWSTWEGRISRLIQEPIENLKHSTDDQFALAFARIENHYFINKGFLPRDGFLLEKDQLDKIRHIPTFIVQGRYDAVARCLRHSSLTQDFAVLGHCQSDNQFVLTLLVGQLAPKRLKECPPVYGLPIERIRQLVLQLAALRFNPPLEN